jgi:hypothetical protein
MRLLCNKSEIPNKLINAVYRSTYVNNKLRALLLRTLLNYCRSSLDEEVQYWNGVKERVSRRPVQASWGKSAAIAKQGHVLVVWSHPAGV